MIVKTEKNPTYISLFSSAGVGCYGFKLENFDCIATNEIIPRRLDVQKFNNKCKYESGYICGDITESSIKDVLYEQIEFWKREEQISGVDVVIATPPCQGMSVANHKKSKTEIVRNSLVVESIKIIKKISPRFFIFENVPAFMKTICTDIDGEHKTIGETIENNLGEHYSYIARVINFKNYGACSSRQRTVVIGVSKDFADEVSPFELYPNVVEEKTLREVIGKLKPLKEFGEIDSNDIYHSFRVYPAHMRNWISGIKEGESAFDNIDDSKKPHRIIDGKIVINQRKNADKYTRQYWDKVGPCIHTRNDLMASQNTLHPSDDRVFSIRELMLMMTVPNSFKWVNTDFDILNNLNNEEKRAFLKKEEIKIRQSLGEAVPTAIFQSIAKKMAKVLKYPIINTMTINKIVLDNKLSNVERLKDFIIENPMNLSPATLGRIAELANTSRTDNAAFFTGKSLITEMIKNLPDIDKDTVHILEPSVGVGNFIPLIIKKFEGKQIILDVIDVDLHSIEIAKLIVGTYEIPENCEINYIHDDFLLHHFERTYDYIIGNPPFLKMKSNDKKLSIYRSNAINTITTNVCSYFMDKAVNIGNYIALVFPKFLLNTPEFAITRKYLSKKEIECIIDFGEKGFEGVLVETLAIFVNNLGRPAKTRIISIPLRKSITQSQKYIFDEKLPYWIIYRDTKFDSICKKMDFNVFKVFRDRQITNSKLNKVCGIRVLKSRNLSDDGKEILDIDNYNSYIDYDILKELTIFKYLERDDVFLTPNMTYKPRMIKKPKHCVVNGSLAIMIPKKDIVPTKKQLEYFSTQEYREFYRIARNYQTRSLNIDAYSVFFYGLLRDEEKEGPITEKFDG